MTRKLIKYFVLVVVSIIIYLLKTLLIGNFAMFNTMQGLISPFDELPSLKVDIKITRLNFVMYFVTYQSISF